MTRLYQYFIALFLVLQTPEIAAKLRRRSLAGDTSTNNATASTSNIFLDRDEAPRWDPSDEKIALCFGDCSEDESCEPGLFCYHRDPELEPEVHGCSEKDNAHLSTTSSVCVAELPAGYSVEVALQSRLLKFRRLNNFCVGDCDNDEECGPGLVCFQRDVGDPIPQCPNKALNTPRDYCVYPEETRSNLLGECEGDCNQDADCQDGLVCQQRNAFGPIPQGCAANRESSTDYCVRPNRLALCQGDCDTDRDCKDDLVCWQRDAGDPEPPGCTGINLNWSTDFCVRPPNNGENGRASDQGESVPVPTLPVPAPASVAPVTPAPTPTPSFQLKLYWELGYNWQDEYTETFWCLTRDIPDETCWHGLTRIVCVSTETYVTRCRNNDRQQWQFEYVNNDEALIRAAGTNRCLERSGWDINLVQCDASNSRQHFYAVRGGFNQDRFEIGQKSMRDFCMSQDHHPKNNEYVQMFPCSWNRHYTSLTSYWEKYVGA